MFRAYRIALKCDILNQHFTSYSRNKMGKSMFFNNIKNNARPDAKCGDIMRMYIKVDKDSQTITDVKFNTFGCGSAIASSSMATEMIKGKTIEEALAVSNKEVVEALDGLPAHKLHCSVLAEEAIKTAVKDYYDKNNIPYDHSRFPDCENCGSCHMV